MRTVVRTMLCLLAAAALPPGPVAAVPLRVVATTSDLASLAREVGGERLEVRAICTGREDPHMVQGKPSFILAARDADLWIRVGLDLEIGWEPVVIEGARNPRILPGRPGHLDAGALIEPLDVPTAPVTRDQGDVHPSGNPHYWTDPWNGRVVARGIAGRLAQLDPAGADHYAARLADFRRRLDERMFGAALLERMPGDEAWTALRADELEARVAAAGVHLGGWYAAMRPLRGMRIVTYHRSWTYFARRFGLEVVAEIEPKPGIPPSAAWLEALTERARAAGVRIILQEPSYSERAARRLADRIGAAVVVAPISVGAVPEAPDYLALLDTIVSRLTTRSR